MKRSDVKKQTSLKEMVRRHDIIIAALIVCVCISALLLNKIVSEKYDGILLANMYLNSYKASLDEVYMSLDDVIGSAELDEAAFDEKTLLLRKNSSQFLPGIASGDLWRPVTDISNMTENFLEQVECVKRLSVQGYRDAAIPIAADCMHLYDLIRNAYDECNRTMMEINERERVAAKRFTTFLLIAEGALAVSVIIIAIRVLMRLIGKTVKPIENLSRKVSATAFNSGELNQLPEENSGVTEVNELKASYNSFIRRINDQMEKVSRSNELERQLLEEEAKSLRATNLLKVTEIKALQNRINPHFLFNSLNMITGTAYMEGAEKTTDLMELLGSYLRYNLDKFDKMVTLKDETDNVRDYLEIQRVRMGSKFTYEIELDEEYSSGMMPCLTLQPMVENSIRHGLKNNMMGGIIRVACRGKDGRIIMDVYDNGTGISKDKLEELRGISGKDPFTEAPDSDSIGVRNVLSRLNLYFDGDINVEIDSDGASFTRFIIDIPYTTEERTYGI